MMSCLRLNWPKRPYYGAKEQWGPPQDLISYLPTKAPSRHVPLRLPLTRGASRDNFPQLNFNAGS